MAGYLMGAGSGELAGLQFLQKQKQEKEQLRLQQLQSYNQSRLDEQRIAQEEQQVKMNEMKMRQAADEERSRKREAALLSSAYAVDAPFRQAGTALQADEKTAKMYSSLAEQLAPHNPKLSREYADKALDITTKLPDKQKKIFDSKQAARQERSDMLGDVTDQASWDVFRAISAGQLGLPVPAQYKDWNNPATKEWIQNQNVFSKAGKIAADAQYRAAKFEADQKLNQASIEQKEASARASDAKIAASRDGVKPVKEQSRQDFGTEFGVLDSLGGKFSSASSGAQTAAAKHVPVLTQQYMKSKEAGGLGLTQSDAVIKARETIANSFDENGKFTPPTTTQQKQEAAKQGDAPQAALDMLAKNPALKEQFKAKYGYLPQGY